MASVFPSSVLDTIEDVVSPAAVFVPLLCMVEHPSSQYVLLCFVFKCIEFSLSSTTVILSIQPYSFFSAHAASRCIDLARVGFVLLWLCR